ncbi:universal stress protein [Frankia sp. Mgl5]|uniref:universal stress protein n=1 Tax=Frankia sp. Mgl5 TaxID=2933793 RepID=UPI00200F524F|nr:universal stress protein [Frankia sp. Mgl5]MCK9925962.1 universal stress protein [Frankia sp. Mgl5]
MTEIIVGVDASAASASALRWALVEAGLHRVGVRAVLAWSGRNLPPARGPVAVPSASADLEAAAAAVLHRAVEDAVDSLGARGRVRVTESTVRGLPAHALVRESAAGQMLVVGAPAASRHRRAATGSLAEVCVREARVPVVIAHHNAIPGPTGRVPADQPERTGPDAGPAIGCRERLPVLVGVDGSAPSLAAVRWATREACLRGVPLVMANARPHWSRVPSSFPGSWRASRDGRITEEILDYCAAESRRVCAEVTVLPLAVDGVPAASLLRLARDAQLLVVGGRDTSAFGPRPLRAPGRDAVIHAPCPVVVVRPEWTRCPVPVGAV